MTGPARKRSFFREPKKRIKGNMHLHTVDAAASQTLRGTKYVRSQNHKRLNRYRPDMTTIKIIIIIFIIRILIIIIMMILS